MENMGMSHNVSMTILSRQGSLVDASGSFVTNSAQLRDQFYPKMSLGDSVQFSVQATHGDWSCERTASRVATSPGARTRGASQRLWKFCLLRPRQGQ